ncbi:hypothetical protein [Microbispora sp. ATCC PTA-5024]|uniref:hypothetical protein n=1 Tax=Microbispora sp. ATCC PTA-5024 TaxID=316330 RepID=UPI0003DC8702|nr:hypothetical protein [Microbispora sp. ATCC PTA-5024]ETK31462.1 hypothetical protein MPTA5024_34880 [Microbispora sp. ATCC PTA-5024]
MGGGTGTGSPRPGWAAGRFGHHAESVRRRLVAALAEAVGNAQDAQRWSRSDKRFPFGHTLMTRRYEALVEVFRDEPGFHMVRPYGSPHHLVILDGNLLLPFRYAEDDTTPITEARVGDGRISALVRELFTRFGPAASYLQEELDLSIEERDDLDRLRPALARLPDDTRLVPVAYAGNAHAGLLRLYWGEAELLDDFGRLRWLHHEQIPLALAAGAHLAEIGAGHGRFDDGAPPELGLRPHTSRVPDEAAEGTAVAAGDEHA